MLYQDQVRKDILYWLENFVERPHPALGNWAPCPYARRARLENDFEIRLGLAPIHDLVKISKQGLGGKSVVVVVYEADQYRHESFSTDIETANREFLLPNNMLALEDHPDDVEMVNGVCMNQGTYALALVQSLDDLNVKAQQLANKGFYNSWTEEYLKSLFKHRKDPRS
jgi:hypothetical protein